MSFGYLDETPKVNKRQPHKRKSEKITKKETAKAVFERFIEFKQKQKFYWCKTLEKWLHLHSSAKTSNFPFAGLKFFVRLKIGATSYIFSTTVLCKCVGIMIAPEVWPVVGVEFATIARSSAPSCFRKNYLKPRISFSLSFNSTVLFLTSLTLSSCASF